MAQFEMDERRIIYYFANMFIPLTIGCVLYYVFCPDVFFVRVIDCALRCGFHIELNSDWLIVRLCRFYLFDVLWAYSLTFAVISISNYVFNTWIMFAGIIVFEIIMELLQVIAVIPGTFDIWDMVAEIFVSVWVMVIIRKKEGKK